MNGDGQSLGEAHGFGDGQRRAHECPRCHKPEMYRTRQYVVAALRIRYYKCLACGATGQSKQAITHEGNICPTWDNISVESTG